MELTTVKVTSFAGVGEKVAAKLAKLNIHNAQDVLFHLPFRYEDRTSYSDIGRLGADSSGLIRGEILSVQQVPHGRRSLLVNIADETGQLTMRMFHFSFSQKQEFKTGYWLECFGDVVTRPGAKEMIHPEYRVLPQKPLKPKADSLTPIYPTTDGVSQHLLRKLTDQALTNYLPKTQELVPQELVDKYQFPPLTDALVELHRPKSGVDLHAMIEMRSPSSRRLIFEELLALQLGLGEVRRQRLSIKSASCLMDDKSVQMIEQFKQSLGFELTGAQQRVVQEISSDLSSTSAMARLVQGDVGSGKTVVAAFAIMQAVGADQQVALMAPTELLAEQLFTNMQKWLKPLGINVGWLTGNSKVKQRRETLAELLSGDIQVLVGTHALFQSGVEFQRLGLVVIDEQHRFGVGQRYALLEKSKQGLVPHQLIMSATPIPRTLAMSLYGDIDVSTIDELPPNRQTIDTVVISAEQRRHEVIQRVYDSCLNKRQVYWVCPLVEESEHLQAQAVTKAFEELSQALSGVRVEMIHGQMKAAEKEAIMQRFRDHEIDLLLATTVIEVGVDVPNASLMIIENAERMGLAQLHQLRGRVGRGSQKSVCVLMYQMPLSNMAKQRLQVMRETNDGFIIARKDLELRGPGEMLGVRQTGAMSLKVANLVRDEEWLEPISEEAIVFQKNSPEQAQALINRWFSNQQQFANV